MHSIALATPSSCLDEWESQNKRTLRGKRAKAYLSNVFSSLASTFDLLLIGSGGDERFRDFLGLEVVNVCSDTESLDSIGVEMLISEERSNDSRKTSCESKNH